MQGLQQNGTSSEQAATAAHGSQHAAKLLWFQLEGQTSPACQVRLGERAAWVRDVTAAPRRASGSQQQDWRCTVAVDALNNQHLGGTVLVHSGLQVLGLSGYACS